VVSVEAEWREGRAKARGGARAAKGERERAEEKAAGVAERVAQEAREAVRVAWEVDLAPTDRIPSARSALPQPLSHSH